MSQNTDPSENPSHESSEPPTERSASVSQQSIPHTILEWHDSSEDSNATSHKTPVRSATPVPVYGPQTGYGLRGRVTARKSVPIPIRRTFRIPLRDDAGPSNRRGQSSSSSPSSPSSESRGTMLIRHDKNIDALVQMWGTSNQAIHRVIDALDHTKASIQQLCMIVYLLMALIVIMFGCLMFRARF